MQPLHRLLAFLAAGFALTGCVDPDLRRGQEALGQGRYPLAIQHLERARARDPEDVEVLQGLASAHRSIALGELAAGRCDAAAGQIAAADALTPPELVDHQALLACRERIGGSPATRIAELERLVAAGDQRARILRMLMQLYLDQGRHTDAVRLLDRLEARFALTTDDRRKLADVFLQTGQTDAALKQLYRVKADDPSDPLVRLKLAELLEARGQLPEAEQMYRALAADYRTNPVVFLRLAAFLRRRGDVAGAAEAQATADRLRGIEPDQRTLRDLPRSRK
ncbi:MAG: tetratricopeptide repeat protein [Myxococcales bacterium]|nr:tetratricopeptide repeat protein [Myxococcales bacterium]